MKIINSFILELPMAYYSTCTCDADSYSAGKSALVLLLLLFEAMCNSVWRIYLRTRFKWIFVLNQTTNL